MQTKLVGMSWFMCINVSFSPAFLRLVYGPLTKAWNLTAYFTDLSLCTSRFQHGSYYQTLEWFSYFYYNSSYPVVIYKKPVFYGQSGFEFEHKGCTFEELKPENQSCLLTLSYFGVCLMYCKSFIIIATLGLVVYLTLTFIWTADMRLICIWLL